MTNSSSIESLGDDFTKDLVGSNSYGFALPAKKHFFPWHKPRKQFVREKQWTQLIDELLTSYYPENKIIKYLGLPGDDLLDLRHFHERICVPRELKLRFLGFNTGMEPEDVHRTNLEISLDEINRLPYVDDRSDLIPDDFVSISGDDSLSWIKSKEIGPFDVINIDLCHSFAKSGAGEFEQDHYNTLKKLMVLQSFRKEPWLLFLTTRTNKESINFNVFETLKAVYLKNLNTCSGFLEKSKQLLGIMDEESLNKYCCEELGFSNIFLTGLSKWILTMGLNKSPQSAVEIKNIMGYKVHNKAKAPDMISIALQISPVMNMPEDPLGLATKVSSLIDECSKAVEMLDKISSQEDVDETLYSSPEINSMMIQQTSDLLKKARYDINGYEEWVIRNTIASKPVNEVKSPNAEFTRSTTNPPGPEFTSSRNPLDGEASQDHSRKPRLSGLKIVDKIDLTTFDKFKKKPK